MNEVDNQKEENQELNNINENAEVKEDTEKKDEKHHGKDHKKKKGKSDKETIEELQAKYNELNDKFLRLFAEFENYRKRSINERLELIKNASEDVIKQLLPIVDDYERALKSMNDNVDVNSIKEGTELIYNKLKTLLEQKKVKEMVSIGELFNTDFHEAITTIPAPSEDMKGKVLEEVQKGYTLNDKVIRYAKVIVGN
jgi:molecular chaperone GrpE